MLLALACAAPPEETEVPAIDTGGGTAEVSLVDDAIDFGEVAAGGSGTDTVSLVNLGSGSATVTGVSTDAADVELSLASGTPIPAGQTVGLDVVWSPTHVGELQGSVEIVVTAEGAGLVPLTVSLAGEAVGPMATLSVSELMLPATAVGCSSTASVVLANLGTRTLEIEGVSFAEQEGLELSGVPDVIADGGTADLVLTWSPRAAGSFSTLLELTTNDPANPVIAIPVSGNGYVESADSVSYTVKTQNVTVLFALNAVITTGMFADRLSEALPYFFEGLQAADVKYRAAFVVTGDGQVAGDVTYIDETFTPDQAEAIAAEMIDGAAGDNDYLLDTLDAAIEEQRAWLLDENIAWTNARLNLVGLNTDQEQSSGDALSWVTKFRTYKAAEADVVVHAIGGPVPGGCTGADPFTQFYEATVITGGQFFSVCDEDWTANFVTLGEAALGRNLSFPLDGTPQEDTIAVYIDDVETDEGWAYEDELNAIVFEDSAYPDEGSELRIDYALAVECPE